MKRELHVHSIWTTKTYNLPDKGALYIMVLLWQKHKIHLLTKQANALLRGEVVNIPLGLVETEWGEKEHDVATIFITEVVNDL